MEQQLIDALAWIEPRAFVLALVLPLVIRIVGHWLPEELFMITIGVLAARLGTPRDAVILCSLVVIGHFVTDQMMYVAGRWLRPRLARFPRIRSRLEMVTSRLEESPRALYGLIPARVLPLGRGAWLAGCGVVGIPWRRFAAMDLTALLAHLATWSGFGWWLAGDLGRVVVSAEVGPVAGGWLLLSLALSILVILVLRRWPSWQPVNAVRRAARTLRRLAS